ncbi:timeless-domain-containing protein [Aulographum hederae CBS 113979]|uniref:Topoisomerase 1-associated factor 1 n=1 Tax=Aulographum hederae CBS 113979 TaxID=1176131 RepID=A0A6G1H269_9PEZI|nr:timeless-domain-containing protein [Aulographum hederae CBS 113979]
MDGSLDDWVIFSKDNTVDPHVRAKIYAKVSEVGGPAIELDGRYKPGPECEGALKDLNDWLGAYDEKRNVLDAKRCMAEANLVKGDLLELLAQWPEEETEKNRIPLRCLTLLVRLTHTLDFEDAVMKVNHHRHLPYIQLSQVGYKRAILHHDTAHILRTVVRICLPAIAQPRHVRNDRMEHYIIWVLHFLTNVLTISRPPNLPSDGGDDSDIARSAVIEAFHQQDIFAFLLTLTSGMGEDYTIQDTAVLEALFHLIKGIDPEKLFMEEKILTSANTDELKGLIQKEKAMLAGYARHAPSRHNRFGTMIWVKRDDERVSTVTGQDVLGNAQKSLQKMDKTKKWNKPKHRGKNKEDVKRKNDFDIKTPITESARKHLRSLVEDFLDSSFNPLFTQLRRSIERNHERVLSEHPLQYFYLVSWFLQAERARRKRSKTQSAESFGLIASVLNQEFFILLNRSMQRYVDEKSWKHLSACMKCFTQILLTVQEMSASSLEEDLDISENIQNRIFYEETNHDRVIQILKSYKDQGFDYLDTCTELAHVFLRMLEQYSKQNIDLQVRSRRRTRRKKKEAAQSEGGSDAEEINGDPDQDMVVAQIVTTERKFDFARFCARFMTQPCINTFVALARLYNDLNADQLKRAHRFFYRVAFKMELGVTLYRVDIIQLFNRMIKGPDPLDKDLPSFKEWEDLVKQIFKRLVKKVQERPELMVEMLFSKIPATMFYLEHGYDRAVSTRVPRPPAELEVRPGMEMDEQIGVAVSVLINQSKSDALAWVKKILHSASEERQSWHDAETARKEAQKETQSNEQQEGEAAPSVEEEAEPKAPTIFVKPDNDERRVAMFKDNKLRLLMTLIGWQRIGLDDDPDAAWIVPSALTAAELKSSQELIGKFEFDPPTYDDGKAAEDLLRSKAAARRKRAEYDDDNSSADEDEILFAAGGPTERKSDAIEYLKKKRGRRSRRAEADEVDDEEKLRKAEVRRKLDDERRKKVKSAYYVQDSDDEDDEERDRAFFAAEKERRMKAGRSILKAMTHAKLNEKEPAKEKGKKRKVVRGDESENESEKGDSEDEVVAVKAMKKRKTLNSDSDNEVNSGTESEKDNSDAASASSRAPSIARQKPLVELSSSDDEEETPLSSQLREAPLVKSSTQTTDVSVPNKEPVDTAMTGVDDDDEDDLPVRRAVLPRRRGGFVIDDDDSD